MKFAKGILVGILFIMCLAAAVPRYLPPQPKPLIYTMTADPNDPIYAGFSLNAQYLGRFGNSERTIVFYNIALNSARIKALEKQMSVLIAPQEPNEAPISEPNQPNIKKE